MKMYIPLRFKTAGGGVFMDKVIENILISRATNQEKYAQIEKLEKDIEMARKILSVEKELLIFAKDEHYIH